MGFIVSNDFGFYFSIWNEKEIFISNGKWADFSTMQNFTLTLNYTLYSNEI